MSQNLLEELTSDGDYQTWLTDPAEEDNMEDLHYPFWKTFISTISERSLANKTVMDFGCSTGGFLRSLHLAYPFKRGIGIDKARDSVKTANARKGKLPLEYHVAANLEEFRDQVDVMFSYEVIFLLPDLNEHAANVAAALKENGVYYAATGCHTSNPLWPRWKELVNGESSVGGHDYSLEDFAVAFQRQGFNAGVTRLRHNGFIKYGEHIDYFPTVNDCLDYYSRDIVVFRFSRGS